MQVKLVSKFVYKLSVVKRSYYEILDLQPNFTEKQLRQQFLKKARQLHPDHNNSPSAHDQFKLVKQAYEVLRDPMKKYTYESGINTTSQDSPPPPMGEQSIRQGQKYYQNKWYGYKRNNVYDLRDQYYQRKADYYATGKPIIEMRYVLMLITGLGVMFGYDMLIEGLGKSQEEKDRERVQKVLTEARTEPVDKKQASMKRYIERRAKVHAVQ